jgi:glutamine amidotransferase
MAALVTREDTAPLPLSSLLFDPPHSLSLQARQPAQQRPGVINVDGTGIVWWGDDAPEPLRYATDGPYWSDPNLPWLAPRLRAHRQLALVRSATPGIPYGTAFVSPFVHGPLAGAHNGWIGAFRERTARPLLERLPDDVFAAYHASSDSLVLFLTIVAEALRDPGAALTDVLRRALSDVADVCEKHEAQARLNVAVGDGTRIVAARSAVGQTTDSLWVLEGGRRWRDANLLASEPLDDDAGWTRVADGGVVEITAGGVTQSVAPELVR